MRNKISRMIGVVQMATICECTVRAIIALNDHDFCRNSEYLSLFLVVLTAIGQHFSHSTMNKGDVL